MTKSLRIALRVPQLQRAWIVYPGKGSYPVDERVDVIPWMKSRKNLPASPERR